MRRVVLAVAGGGAALVACSLTSLDGLSGGSSSSGPTTAFSDARDGEARDAIAADAASKVDGAPVACDRLRVGARCEDDRDCCSDNCYQFTCAGNFIGSKCDDDYKCTSNNCYQFTCEGTGKGARCSDDSKCASNVCLNFTCE